MEWLEAHPLPIGDVAEDFVDWLTANFTPLFDGLTAFLQAVIDAILRRPLRVSNWGRF